MGLLIDTSILIGRERGRVVHGLSVLTDNARDFSRVPGLDVVVPAPPSGADPAP